MSKVVKIVNGLKWTIVLSVFFRCEALKNVNLLKYGENSESGGNISFMDEDSYTKRYVINQTLKTPNKDIPPDVNQTVESKFEAGQRNHSIIDVEYNQTESGTNSTSSEGITMTSYSDVLSGDAVFTVMPPRQDFLALGESKTYICRAEENSKVINTHWVIPMSVDTYRAEQKSHPGINGYISMNASIMEIFNMQVEFAGTYICIGYGENGTISRQMELETTQIPRVGFSLRITIGLSAFGGLISILLLTVLFFKIKHLLALRFGKGRVKPNTRKTVHFNVDEVTLVHQKHSQQEHVSLANKELSFLENSSTKSSDSGSYSNKSFDDESDTLPRVPKLDGWRSDVPILMVNGATTDPDFDSKSEKIESPKSERSAPRFQVNAPSKCNRTEKETRF